MGTTYQAQQPGNPNTLQTTETGFTTMPDRSPSASTTAAVKALSKPVVLRAIVHNLDADLLESGRLSRQGQLNKLATVARSWTLPVNECLYNNPYLGSAVRAKSLLHSIAVLNPGNGDLVRKLILGEGTDEDIHEWPSPTCPSELIRASKNVITVGFDGLDSVDLPAFAAALKQSKYLVEVRACDLMPHSWATATTFFHDLLVPNTRIRRLKLYGLSSSHAPDTSDGFDRDPEPGNDISRAGDAMTHCESEFTHVALNYCSIKRSEFLNIFSGSEHTLRELELEGPEVISHDDLLDLLETVGSNLRRLVITDFADVIMEDGGPDEPPPRTTVDRILELCPNLNMLDFACAEGSTALLEYLVGGHLTKWRFSCHPSILPVHWMVAFEQPGFPKNAKCRIFCPEWSDAEFRSVQIRAWQHGMTWLSDGEASMDFENEVAWS